jgi:Vacuolar sorting protein 9 (VPS9) domain
MHSVDALFNERYTFISFKADAVEYNPKEELVTMDDELPIIIYIVLMSEFTNQYAEVQFVDDFSNTDATIESERRVLTNIRVSLDYISSEW